MVTRVLHEAAPMFGVNHGTLQSAWQQGNVQIFHGEKGLFVVLYSGGLAIIVLDES